MANIKSAKKRVLIAEANRQRNVAVKSEIKTAIKNGTTVAYSTYKDINGDNKVNSTDYQLLYGIIKGHIQ